MMHSSLKVAAVAALVNAAACSSPSDSGSDTKIIGGRLADYQPFMVRISDQGEDNRTGYCGGSWIAEGVVLTAAHCVEDMRDLAKVTVSIKKESDIGPANSMNVRAILSHPDYDPNEMHNDLALIFVEELDHSGLARPVSPIPLNSEAALPEELGVVTVIGWGNESSYGYLFGDDLRQVEVPVISGEQCRSAGDSYSTVGDDEICAGDFDNGAIDSCQGDSGGPLIATRDGEAVLVGIVSWGINCANKRRPGVYARVSSFTSWIYEQIGKHSAPVFPTQDAVFQEAIAQHCYTGFKSESLPYADDIAFEIAADYKLSSEFSPQTQPSDRQNPLSTCEFSRLGLGTVSVNIFKTDEKSMVAVNAPEVEKYFTATVSEELSLETPCVNADQKAFRLELSKTDGGWLRAEDQWFHIGDEILKPDLSGYTLTTCTTHGTTLQFGSRTDKSGTVSYLVVLASTELDLARTTYQLSGSSSSPGGKLTGNFAFADATAKEGNFSLTNKTGDDIHTWVLDCPFEMTLSDIYGVAYIANQKSEGHFTHTFVTPASIHGIIASDATLTFTTSFSESVNRDQFDECEINGMSFDPSSN